MSVHFVDEAVILVRSGKGGDGCMSFRREKYVPRGGPDGGNGGRGGHVTLVAEPQVTTLLDIGRRHLYAAESGRQGTGKNRYGRNGEDLRIPLPVGTLVRDRQSGELLHDLDTAGLEIIIAHGGKGGRGNKVFATATNQAPREWEPGEPEEERELALELKLMADVGLVGFPNAGKSTLLSHISAATPRIADYPFTTLAPQLGIVELDGERRLTVADIPGLIEGAHEGVGLGIEFLRHIERTGALIHLVDPQDRSLDEMLADYATLRGELEHYSAELLERPIVTAISKMDLLPEAEREEMTEAFSAAVGTPICGISGVTGAGVGALLERVWTALNPVE